MSDQDLRCVIADLTAECKVLRQQVASLVAAEEGAKEAFGVVVQENHDAQAECGRLRDLLTSAHAQIRKMADGLRSVDAIATRCIGEPVTTIEDELTRISTKCRVALGA